MRAILPRQATCVLCGDPLKGPGRIDRLYCSASCRNLAWRFRTGKRGGRPQAAASTEAQRRRGALLRAAWGVQGELIAARRWIGELETQLAQTQRLAATERQCVATLNAELLLERADRLAEKDRLCAASAASEKVATGREAELAQRCREFAAANERLATQSTADAEVISLLKARCQQAEARAAEARRDRDVQAAEREALKRRLGAAEQQKAQLVARLMKARRKPAKVTDRPRTASVQPTAVSLPKDLPQAEATAAEMPAEVTAPLPTEADPKPSRPIPVPEAVSKNARQQNLEILAEVVVNGIKLIGDALNERRRQHAERLAKETPDERRRREEEERRQQVKHDLLGPPPAPRIKGTREDYDLLGSPPKKPSGSKA